MPTSYLHNRVQTKPRAWKAASDELTGCRQDILDRDGGIYGVWRSQIGRPRDELNVITTWSDVAAGTAWMSRALTASPSVVDVESWVMTPTLRPDSDTPPTRQGNYAFRHFQTPPENWDEFLQLCAEGWPGFEASYDDSQVIGLWRYVDCANGPIDSLLLTRRPGLAMWERSKLPQGAVETEVRRKLSRRYDLCEATYVHTTTLLTAADEADEARWT